jgi:hypothetical protein
MPYLRTNNLLACSCWLGLLAGCDNSDSAPPAPDHILDGGSLEEDAGPPVPIDCENSVGAQDADGDGFSRDKGDCDDCTKARGPAAMEILGNMIDEDCDGSDLTTPPPACDGKLEPESTDAEDAAHALGVCEEHSENSRLPGLIEARWQRLTGEDAPPADARQIWLPTQFGTIAAREGGRLLVLSTGVARDVNDDAYTKDCDVFDVTRSLEGWAPSSPPLESDPDYPLDSSECPKGTNSSNARRYNDVVLTLTLRTPSNVKSFSFDSMFFTYEYPDFVCSEFNDFFLVRVDPPPKEIEDDKRGNVLFDSEGDPIGVNSGLLSVCREAERGRVARPIECTAGPALLAETGFDQKESVCASKQTDKKDIGGASTGWLHTSVPVPAGKVVTLQFVLWDSADPLLDSTVVVDNFQWSVEEQSVITGPITGG